MSTLDYSRWNSNPSVRTLQSPGGLTLLLLDGPFGSAKFSPQGAHLAEFQPRGGAPLLFVSSRSHFTPGKAIRGGIPVIFPWFGPREGHPESPMHGLVRTRAWAVDSIETPENEPATIRFSISSDAETLAVWPHAFHLSLEFRLGKSLQISWRVKNTGEETFTFEQALHPYFPVTDVHRCSVTGLEGSTYIDKTDHLIKKTDTATSVTFNQETDRLYLNTTSTCTLLDPAAKRRLIVAKTGSESSVVWNPWITKAAALEDMEDCEWQNFVCVEQVNAATNAVSLQPGATHLLTAHYEFSDLISH